MKSLGVRIASLFLCLQFLVPATALAAVFPDREIRLLAVSANGTSTVQVIQQLTYLEAHWPGSAGVTINLVNGGVPVPLGGAALTGTALNQLNQAKARAIWNQYRATWGADLMIVFTPSMSGADCGRVIQYNWTSVDDPIPGLFVPDPLILNLDLRGASNGYAASAEASTGCPILTAAHELAHLLGSGHTFSVAAGKYLTNTSHAAAFVTTIPLYGTIGYKTIEAQGGNPPECGVTAGVTCQYLAMYSAGNILTLPEPANTLATFETTALSVANYFAGSGGGGGGGGSGGSGGQHPQCNDGIDNDGDGQVDYPNDSDCASLGDDNESDSGGGGGGGGGGCGLQVPSNLVATLVGVCVPDPWTQYTLTWTDTCPSASHSYEIYYRQPATSGIWKFGWKSFVPSTPAFVTGANSRVRVRACGLLGCSGYSSSVLLLDAC